MALQWEEARCKKVGRVGSWGRNENWFAYTLASRVDKRNMSAHPYRFYDT